MVKSEANKLKEGNRARAGPGFRNSGMGCWALVLRLTVESVQSQVIPGPYGSKVSSNTGAFLRVLTPCPDTEETPHVRASGLWHASGASAWRRELAQGQSAPVFLCDLGLTASPLSLDFPACYQEFLAADAIVSTAHVLARSAQHSCEAGLMVFTPIYRSRDRSPRRWRDLSGIPGSRERRWDLSTTHRVPGSGLRLPLGRSYRLVKMKLHKTPGDWLWPWSPCHHQRQTLGGVSRSGLHPGDPAPPEASECSSWQERIFFFFNFIYLFIYLFIYFWLCWVFGSCEGFL